MLRCLRARLSEACAVIVMCAGTAQFAVGDPLIAVDHASVTERQATAGDREPASAGIVSIFVSDTRLSDLEPEAFADWSPAR